MYSRLKDVAHFFIDLDGTVCKGTKLFETSPPFIDLLKKRGISYTYLTNNSSRNSRQCCEHLNSIGLDASPEEIYTSTIFAVNFLKENHPEVQKVYMLGTQSMRSEMDEHGFSHDDVAPEAVLVGFDMELTYHSLCRAAYWIKKGKPFITTHPDRFCPTDQETLLVDCGSITACLEEATGKKAVVLGKPNTEMIFTAARKMNLPPEKTAMIGDNLDTDIKMAVDAGVLGIHISSSNLSEKQYSEVKPDISVRNLGELGALL